MMKKQVASSKALPDPASPSPSSVLNRYKNLIDLAPLAIGLSDAQGNCLYVNPGWCELMGVTRDFILGASWLQLVALQDRQCVKDIWQDANIDGRKFCCEFRLKRPKTDRTWVQCQAGPLYDEPGRFIGYLGTFTDISERKKMEETLASHKARLENAQRLAHIGDWDYNLQSGELTWSEEMFRTFDLSPSDYRPTYPSFLEMIHPLDRQSFKRSITEISEDCPHRSNRYRIVLPDMSLRYIQEHVQAEFDGNLTPVRLRGTCQDNTAAVATEEALRASQKQYQTLFETMSEGFALHEVICNSNGVPCDYRFLEVNARFEELTGMRRENILNKTVGEVAPDTDPQWISQFGEVALIGTPICFEHYLKEQNRVVRIAAYRPHIGQFAVLFTDITSQYSMQKQLQESEERFRAIAMYSHDWENWFAPDGRLLWVNPSVARFTGHAVVECMQMPDYPFCLIHEDDRDNITRRFKGALAEHSSGHNITFRIRHKEKGVRWMAAAWQPIYHDDNRYAGLRVSIRDITRRKEAEDQLERSNRELDAFVHTVAHDLRTPLTPIIGFAQYLQRQYGQDLCDEASGILQNIESEGLRMMAIMEDLLTLARVGHLEHSGGENDSFKAVKEVISRYAVRIAEKKVQVSVLDLPGVKVPGSLLEQIFSNLIGNALNYGLGSSRQIEVGGYRDGERVRFFVRDHGPGIGPEESKRIFELFYRGSSGKQTRGTGIGLATVLKIARLYEGNAWVEKTAGGGCTFFVEVKG